MNPGFFSIFGLLDNQQLEKLEKQALLMKLDAGSHLFQQMDYSENIYGVMEGMIKTGIEIDGGKTMVKRIICAGEIVGLEGITGSQRRTEFAQALNGGTTIMCVPVNIVKELMHVNEQFMLAVVHLVGKNLQQSESRLESLLTADVRTRIMHFLKEHVRGNGSGDQLETLLRFGLTQQDIAQMIGATRQTVAIIMNEMRKENLIDFSRKKIVVKSLLF
jgi:CRP/FNR family transcriptional regulator, cyclic AMP receptor protein